MNASYDAEAHLDAIYAAQDALDQLRGQLRGNLDHDPDTITALNSAVFLVGRYEAMLRDSPLVRSALEVLAEYGLTVADWARANGNTDGIWRGDRCGCPDQRCTGGHHGHGEACGCLAVLVEELQAAREDGADE